jgi:energy-coupling factor transporter ATP-binding protein EcfA2
MTRRASSQRAGGRRPPKAATRAASPGAAPAAAAMPGSDRTEDAVVVLPVVPKPPPIVLNPDQQAALDQILAAIEPGKSHQLTGGAGSGKTTLLGKLAGILQERGVSVVLTAPTHKAVAVLTRKLQAAGVYGVPSATIHSLLSLMPKPHGDRQVFERRQNAPPVMADVVIVDECSMIDEGLLGHIRRWLPNTFVLFTGDPAQLPPVGERASLTFDTPARSHLDTIVRQAKDNPILAAAHIIRTSQGGLMDWSWCVSANRPPFGVYRPGPGADQWMHRGFTSSEFQADPDTFRYLCWTNQRVAEVNQKIRGWIYGTDIPTPLMPGERALIRAPIVQGKTILFATNEEATVVAIAPDAFRFEFVTRGDVAGWVAAVPSWLATLRADDGREHEVHAVRDDTVYAKVLARVADEAAIARKRWSELHEFKAAMARLQSVYALTVHNSQGSTFRNVFVDVADIARRAETNVLETQQLFYVAATRPTHGLILVER